MTPLSVLDLVGEVGVVVNHSNKLPVFDVYVNVRCDSRVVRN